MNVNSTIRPPWINELKESILKKHVQLIILSYFRIKDKVYDHLPKENIRRNGLLRSMRKNKYELGILTLITSESGQFNDNDEDIGRVDITCYLDLCEDNYIAFECKRFLKKDIILSYFHSQFVGEGIQRFQDNKYSSNISIAGTIVFVESGNYRKVYDLFVNELPKICVSSSMLEQSNIYSHNYVFSTEHARNNNINITLTHILMDFTHNKYSLSSYPTLKKIHFKITS